MSPTVEETNNSAGSPAVCTYLLKDIDKMAVKSDDYAPTGHGFEPSCRPINEYLKYGVVAIDKPRNPSSHEVTTWVKQILNCERTGHSGTLDPKVTGVLGICLNRATRLTKSQQNAGKTYVCVIEFEREIEENELKQAIKSLTGHLLQRPPLMCAVKRELRLRWIYSINILEFHKNRALFSVECEAGTYIRTLCTHIGLFIGCGAVMADLRRTVSGITTEYECFTLHDLQDALHIYKTTGNEKYIRRIIKPMESLLINYPRIMIKDTAVNAICYGAQLSVCGVLKYDKLINTNRTAVLITGKGEAVALVKPLVTGLQLSEMKRGIIAKTERVIMEKETYAKCWGVMDEYEIIGMSK